MTHIEIHEFSTGIIVKGTPDNWWAEGFKGYMNLTFSNIPMSVQNAINEGLFTIPEGQIIDKSVIIGREVNDGINDAWSVIAIITQANDDRGRRLDVCRYFLSQGLGKLEDILRWYILEARQPIFNPFEIQQINKPHSYDNKKRTQRGDILNKPELKDLLNIDHYPIIISPKLKCVPLIINELASRKQPGRELISWVYNVEKLTEPWQFMVIYPISDKAEKRIRDNLNNRPQNTLNTPDINTSQSSDNSSQDILTSTTRDYPNSSQTIPSTPIKTPNNQDRSSTLKIPPSKSTPTPLPEPLSRLQNKPLTLLIISILVSLTIGFILGRITENKYQYLVSHLFKNVTVPTLNDMVRDYKDFFGVDDVQTTETIISIIEKDNTDISLDLSTKYKQSEQEKWIKAIKNYQKNADLEPTGIITRNDNTEKRLKCQIQKELKLSNNPEIIEECKKQGITL